MDGEIINVIKVWLTVCILLCYCYGVGKVIPAGYLRLVTIFPVVCLFFYLPLSLTSIHLGGSTAFFIAWLANFKLLLFAFGDGPLVSDPSLSLGNFLAVSCFPIKIQQNPSQKPQIYQNGKHPSEKSNSNRVEKSNPPDQSFNSYAIKALLVALMLKLYDYSESFHPKFVLFIYSWHVYFFLEIILAVTKFLAWKLIGIELEPQFYEPYFSTSLQDFWGRRWNLMVTSILQPSVYKPTVRLATPVVGRKWAPLPAVLGTFFVSAMMHEVIFYYLGRMWPTWETTWFFAIHGVALAVEILAKKALPGKWRLPPLMSVPLTVGFVFVTAIWLFFPQFVRLRIDVKAFQEYDAVYAFGKNVVFSLLNLFSNQPKGHVQ